MDFQALFEAHVASDTKGADRACVFVDTAQSRYDQLVRTTIDKTITPALPCLIITNRTTAMLRHSCCVDQHFVKSTKLASQHRYSLPTFRTTISVICHFTVLSRAHNETRTLDKAVHVKESSSAQSPISSITALATTGSQIIMFIS